MAAGSTPVCVTPGNPTTDSGGKRLGSAEANHRQLVTCTHSNYTKPSSPSENRGRESIEDNILLAGGYTSEVAEPTMEDAGLAPATVANRPTVAMLVDFIVVYSRCGVPCCQVAKAQTNPTFVLDAAIDREIRH
jgi:hypothetical protein